MKNMAIRNINTMLMHDVDTMYWYMNMSGLYCRTQISV